MLQHRLFFKFIKPCYVFIEYLVLKYNKPFSVSSIECPSNGTIIDNILEPLTFECGIYHAVLSLVPNNPWYMSTLDPVNGFIITHDFMTFSYQLSWNSRDTELTLNSNSVITLQVWFDINAYLNFTKQFRLIFKRQYIPAKVSVLAICHFLKISSKLGAIST